MAGSSAMARFFCVPCEIGFDWWKDLVLHAFQRHNSCYAGCTESFASWPDLDRHLLQVHNCCFECSVEFRNASILPLHLRSMLHQDRNSIIAMCPRCQNNVAGFDSALDFAMHIERSHTPLNRPEVLIQAVESWEASYGLHRLLTGPQLDLSFRCGVCYQGFINFYEASSHTSLCALWGARFWCRGCLGRRFGDLSALLSHLKENVCEEAAIYGGVDVRAIVDVGGIAAELPEQVNYVYTASLPYYTQSSSKTNGREGYQANLEEHRN